MEQERSTQLSRTISYALRHHPEEFGLVLDEAGWVSMQDLLAALRKRGPWRNVGVEEILDIVHNSSKKRFEVQGEERIRAFYGHSTPQKMQLEPTTPPARLFHGTTPQAYSAISKEGLKPMKRQYVHLSSEEETARLVALRRTPRPVILVIDALKAEQQGIRFYLGNENVWLAEPIAPEFITVFSRG